MVNTYFKTLALASLTLSPAALAFSTCSTRPNVSLRNLNTRLNVASLSPNTVGKNLSTPSQKKDDENFGSMIDLKGIAFSGLKGKALSLQSEDFPLSGEVRDIIPKDCFESDTTTSLSYLAVSIVGTAICTALGISALNVFSPDNILTLPFWTAYSSITGTVAMGLWVLAHECGHGSFSKDIKVRDTVGYIIHTIMLVPYYSWQRSHAVHHRYTNHMDLGETHVPEPVLDEAEGSFALRASILNLLGKENGIKAWGALQAFLHLGIGWPAYLWIGATGSPKRGMTNHYWPDPITTPDMPKKRIISGKMERKGFEE